MLSWLGAQRFLPAKNRQLAHFHKGEWGGRAARAETKIICGSWHYFHSNKKWLNFPIRTSRPPSCCQIFMATTALTHFVHWFGG